jgi:hypothetical protein
MPKYKLNVIWFDENISDIATLSSGRRFTVKSNRELSNEILEELYNMGKPYVIKEGTNKKKTTKKKVDEPKEEAPQEEISNENEGEE